MPCHVTLLRPYSYTVDGRTYFRGQQTEVPYAVARQFLEDDRFRVVIDQSEKGDTAQETSKSGKPVSKAERLAAIREAADQLDVDVETNWTSDGMPDARALTAILRWQVTSEERNEAMKLKAKTDADDGETRRGRITITKKKDLPESTEADAAAGPVDPTTEDAKEV